MDKDQLQQLAHAIASDTFADNWGYWVLLMALAVVGIAAASFLGTYFAKRGERSAVKADLENILNQVRLTTELTENIRSVVSLGEWSERELRTLRRVKLEELLAGAHRSWEWAVHERDRLVLEEPKPETPSPMPMVMSLAKLYFPELRATVRHFDEGCDKYHKACHAAYIGILKARAAAIQEAVNQGQSAGQLDYASNQAALVYRDNMGPEVMEWHGETYGRLLALDEAAGTLMKTITAVPAKPNNRKATTPPQLAETKDDPS